MCWVNPNSPQKEKNFLLLPEIEPQIVQLTGKSLYRIRYHSFLKISSYEVILISDIYSKYYEKFMCLNNYTSHSRFISCVRWTIR